MDEAEKMRWLTALVMAWITAIVKMLTGLRLTWWGDDRPEIDLNSVSRSAAAAEKARQPVEDSASEVKRVARRMAKGLPVPESALSEQVLGAIIEASQAEKLWLVGTTDSQREQWVSAAHGVAPSPYAPQVDVEGPVAEPETWWTPAAARGYAPSVSA